ncbi:hypothetical protein E2C01_045762 [Portunus trituberculatus]|uniref:Uncharacterized protein n=1 Tax=Portunus trituberculatus TaxID=210409 RepID=A0A5B7G3V0_PORTR|nr:hypothetical protein [Portunus trituberculatus]
MTLLLWCRNSITLKFCETSQPTQSHDPARWRHTGVRRGKAAPQLSPRGLRERKPPGDRHFLGLITSGVVYLHATQVTEGMFIRRKNEAALVSPRQDQQLPACHASRRRPELNGRKRRKRKREG